MSTEHQIQREVIKWRDLMAQRDYRLRNLFAIPNGGARDAVTGARLKAEGVRAGVPDLFLAWPGWFWRGLFIEMKTPRGRLTAPQRACHDDLSSAGYQVAVCRSAQEAIDLITEYLGGIR